MLIALDNSHILNYQTGIENVATFFAKEAKEALGRLAQKPHPNLEILFPNFDDKE